MTDMETIDAVETAVLTPATVEEAVDLLAELEDEGKTLAGGQSLLVLYRFGFVSPESFVSLSEIDELKTITPEVDGGLRIGAAVTQHQIVADAVIGARYPALVDAALCVSSPQVRRRGTIGGNLCHADPTADPPAALIGLGASVEIAGPDGRRVIPVDELFADYMETILEAGELLTAVILPPPGTSSAYVKHRLRGIDTAIVGVGVGLTMAADGVTCESVGIGLAGAGTTPLRASGAEAVLAGSTLTEDAWTEAGRIAAEECEPLDDTEASEWYRRKMVTRFVQRAGALAQSRATGQEELSA
jgi:carbon-monoxide dehydrogenase medium subunit